MIDKIYIFLILGIYFILAFWYYIINSDGEHQFYFKGDYGKKYRANQLFRFVTLIVFTIINFLPTILNLQTNGVKLLAGLFSLSSLCYFFYELLIKSTKKEKFMVFMQNTILKEVPIKTIFEIKINEADYVLHGNDDTQILYQAKTENGPALVIKNEKESLILLPKQNINSEELEFLCKQINIFYSYKKTIPESVKICTDKTFYQYSNEYLWNENPYLKFFVDEEYKQKRLKILKIIGYTILGVVMLFILADWHLNSKLSEYVCNWLLSK